MTATLTSALVGSTLGQRELDTSVSKSPKDERAKHLLYPVTDTLAGACNKHFSEEAMQISKSVHAVLKCGADGAAGVIKQYSSTLSINADLAHAKMVMVDMSLRDVTLENLRAAAKTGFYPNFMKVLFHVSASKVTLLRGLNLKKLTQRPCGDCCFIKVRKLID